MKSIIKLMVLLLTAFSSYSYAYQCDGRQYCTQMRSCEEATWVLENCPDPKMDGDEDGVPCERQWCKHNNATSYNSAPSIFEKKNNKFNQLFAARENTLPGDINETIN